MAVLTAEKSMQIISLLNDVGFPLLQDGFQVGMGWLGQLIKVLIEGVGITGLGIIVFTLILKAITLPFDIYQRIKMRKQTLIMRNMQPELEKLQKQYANDKQMYSQKMMELYKKNGYSMFGACLPMIISLVILIIAFQSLNTYSQYANLSMYENMTSAYNQAVLSHCVLEEDAQEGEITYEDRNGEQFVVIKGKAEDKFVYIEYNKNETNPAYLYKIDTQKMYGLYKEEIDALVSSKQAENPAYSVEDACKEKLTLMGGQAAADAYHDNSPGFLWIGNIWYPDVSYSHPIQSYDSFIKSINKKVTLKDGSEKSLEEVINSTQYDNITSQLAEEKDQPNGYFVLIILSIGLMVLSQLITMLSQKESSKYQSADGSGMRQQKMMMIIMPLIYAVFAFMYSAAFSIYMTMSSLFSIVVTLLSNLIIGRIFAKKEEEALKQKYTRTAPTRRGMQDDKKKNNGKKR